VLSYLHDQSDRAMEILMTSIAASHHDQGLFLSSQPPCHVFFLPGFDLCA